MRFYNTDMVPDNEFGALDNQTLKVFEEAKAVEDEKARRSKLTTSQRANEDIIASLKDQAEAQRALAEALQAQKDAQAAYEAAQKAKADAEAEARRKAAEAEARRKAEEEAKKKAQQGNTTTFTQSSSTNNPAPAPITVSPKPPTPTPTPPPTPPAPPVKTAPIDTILFEDDSVPIEVMTDLIFEDIGGQEIINIIRNDTVNGQNIIYQPIKNMSLVQKQYNPNNILALQATSASYFANFPIKLDNKIPNVGNGPNGKNVYLNTTDGSIVVEVVNLEQDEEVEIEFIVNGTIYEAEI